MTNQMEQFSRAYVQAIATAAGYSVARPDVDDDSVDLSIGDRGSRGLIRSPRIDLQLKCHMGDLPQADPFAYELTKIKNYDDLRPTDFMVPRILVVLFVPDDVSAWVLQSEQELALRRCAWWVSLRGKPPTRNTASITVHIPRTNLFTIDNLQKMMTRVGAGESP